MPWLAGISASADPEIVERFRGGFVGAFMEHQRCVTWPYSRRLHRQVSSNYSGHLNILFSDRFAIPTRDNGAMQVQWPFDFAGYIPSSDQEKKRRILEAIHAVCLWCGAARGWPAAPFEEARSALLDSRFQHLFVSRESLPVATLRCSVKIGVELDLTSMEIFAVLPKRIFAPSLLRLGSRPYPQIGYEKHLATRGTLLYRDGELVLRTEGGEYAARLDVPMKPAQ